MGNSYYSLTLRGIRQTVLIMFERTVREVRFYTPEIFEISLDRHGYEFETGECAVLFNDAGDSRPYSMSSAPQDDALSFLVRRLPGGALSGWLAERRPGDAVRLSPPFGEFRPTAGENPTVLIATGVGVSPFLSLLRSRPAAPGPLRCLYGVRTLHDAVELPLLREKTELQLAVSREPDCGHFHGRVTGLGDTLSAGQGAEFYLCGYDAMIDEVSLLLNTRGVDSARIHTEVFFDSKPPAR